MSNQVAINTPAPDFALDDFRGKQVHLSRYRGQKNILLIFNRGFTWPFCRRHMAQLRRDYDKFVEQDTKILVVGPENARQFARYWQENKLLFTGLPDPKHTVLKLYGQQIKLFKLGRMPAQVLIDKQGTARFVHYGHSMSDITPNEQVLALVEQLNAEASESLVGA